jgi:tetratricopeptide (TPR) repeat protein
MTKYLTGVFLIVVMATTSMGQQSGDPIQFLDKYLAAQHLGGEAPNSLVASDKQLAGTVAGQLLNGVKQFESTVSYSRGASVPLIDGHEISSATYLGELTSAKTALELYQILGDEAGQQRAFDSLGWIYECLGKIEPALANYQSALAISKKLENLAAVAKDLVNIGRVYGRSGQYDLALDYYGKSLAVIGHSDKASQRDLWEQMSQKSVTAAHVDNMAYAYKSNMPVETFPLSFNLSSITGLNDIPALPWPPIAPSTFAAVPYQRLLRPTGKTSLSDVGDRLEEAFNQAGYAELAWYAVPGGFALVSRLEQFNIDGSPAGDRWSATPRCDPVSIWQYLRCLFTATPGYYRVIVFVVTPVPFEKIQRQLTRDEATVWLSAGANKLPSAFSKIEFSSEFTCSALIYEFHQPTKDHDPVFDFPAMLTAAVHLERSGIWAALDR